VLDKTLLKVIDFKLIKVDGRKIFKDTNFLISVLKDIANPS
jgi:hypothetical protein